MPADRSDSELLRVRINALLKSATKMRNARLRSNDRTLLEILVVRVEGIESFADRNEL